MRLIDADAVVNIINSLLSTDEDGADRTVVSLVRFGLNEAKKTVENAPTIDPEELRPKGEWVHREYDESDDSDEYYYCSECHTIALAEFGRYTYVRSDYCPNCGAKMEDEK